MFPGRRRGPGPRGPLRPGFPPRRPGAATEKAPVPGGTAPG